MGGGRFSSREPNSVGGFANPVDDQSGKTRLAFHNSNETSKRMAGRVTKADS